MNSQSNSSLTRTASPGSSQSSTDRKYPYNDKTTPAPPIVVTSPDSAPDPNVRSGSYDGIERTSLGGLDGSATPPRAGTLNRLRSGPKDTIPMVGKPPRKQRSSRFVVSEKVEIERLPPFLGMSSLDPHLSFICPFLSIPLRNTSGRAATALHQEIEPMSCPIRL